MDKFTRRTASLSDSDFKQAISSETHAPIEGAFYAWVDVSSLTDDSEAWCNELLDRFRIAIAPGIDFDEVDGHRYVRISFCGDTKELGAAMDILAANYLKSTSIKPDLFNTEEYS